ncbi:hypothetical protein OGAPHI_006975 [Ogataea philodendri]|uniref:Kinesin motor domain-containing protein n=1 Tax=Ogataea philodendri TaxID=1378263 RepID=A0A9P8NWK8_9ASCO|nr:uncharacterized protein OGAPHI_006975 [Ogataea philodendri]KAH3660389.1 hypothetical protein OGAPHI_006975 [Ogataea philodendri]
MPPKPKASRSRSPSKSPMKSPQKSPSKLLSNDESPEYVNNTNIKVIVRFRPENEMERVSGATNIVSYHSDQQSVSVSVASNSNSFTFDRIFDENTRQEEIFNYSVKQTTDDLAQGYNGTVLCYGQTGSGKSYTMMGDLGDDESKGQTPRIFEQIFQGIENSPKTLEYTVGVSYLEIYNENLRDLLNPKNNSKLGIHENKVDGVYVSNLETLYVSNLNDVYTILDQGNKNRSVGATNMNEQSSRSHAIFQIRLNSKNLEDGIIKTGNLFLVDLAGSEKIDKTGATGQLLEEAKKINSSLSALGNVIYSLTDEKTTHVPYRDSKLTRILQESLGGNSRTTLIINCSPSSLNDQETLSTLRFGSRAKHIKNSVHINSELSNNELKKRFLEQAKINEENNHKIQKLEARNGTLEEENARLKEELEKYKGLSSMNGSSDEIMKLNDKIVQLETSHSSLTKELDQKTARITELESGAVESKESLVKLEALEKAIEHFSDHIEQVETQNKQLKKDIHSLQQMSNLKNTKIKELEQQLKGQEKLVEQDADLFEQKLNHLKGRVVSHRAKQRSVSDGKENSISSDLIRSRPSSKNRIGLNLRIVKPMRGGRQGT